MQSILERSFPLLYAASLSYISVRNRRKMPNRWCEAFFFPVTNWYFVMTFYVWMVCVLLFLYCFSYFISGSCNAAIYLGGMGRIPVGVLNLCALEKGGGSFYSWRGVFEQTVANSNKWAIITCFMWSSFLYFPLIV